MIRTQVCKVNNTLSHGENLSIGIPQGSVLSGPLFLICVNNLCNGNFKGKLVAFADDTALFYKADSLAQIQTDMQHDVHALRWWFTKNLMIMSPKTKYLLFNLSKNVSFNTDLKYHEIDCTVNRVNCKRQNLERVDSIKYLGLVVDSKLNWKCHLENLKFKLVKYIRLFYSVRTICYPKLLRSIYFALINSKTEYGLELWGGTYVTTLKPLINLQKHFIRIIKFKNRFEHSAPLFVTLNILPIKNLYIFKVLKAFYDRSSNTYQINSHYSTRRVNIYIPKPNLTVFKKFYLFLAPKFFNMLPEYLKKCENRAKYLKLLRNFLLLEENVD